ncbi:MAG: hypothetical protein ACRDOJ_08445 [Nocardioidaceae bacterium]
MPSSLDSGRSVFFSSVRRAWPRQPAVARVCYLISAVLVFSGLVHLGIALVSDRPWAGPLSWRKPTTFGLSFGTTLASVTWVVSLLPGVTRSRTTLLGILAADCVLEVLGITVQAWRNVPSHFNKETTFDAAVANALAAGGGVLVIVLGTLAVGAWRSSRELRPSLRLGLRAGFGLLAAGLASGVAMIVRGVSLLGQGAADGRWDDPAYAEAGFVKDFHAVTLHAVLLLPALAVLLGHIISKERARTRVMTAAVALYCVAAVAVLVRTLGG